jgi:CBS domain containing-hemolysin-like protein
MQVESHEVTGIVSMENILEYILGIPIMDEKDKNAQSFFIKSAKKRQSLNKSYVR